MIAILYDKRNGKIIRGERMSSSRMRNLTIYNFAPTGHDTLHLRLKFYRMDNIDMSVRSIDEIEYHPPQTSHQRLGLILHGGIGDHAIATGLIENLKKLHGRISIDAFCYKSPELLEYLPTISKVIQLQKQQKSSRTAKKLSKNKYDAVYDIGLVGARYEDGKLAYTKYPKLYENMNSAEILQEIHPQHILKIRGESIGLRHCRIDEIDIPHEKQNKKQNKLTLSGWSENTNKMIEENKWRDIVRETKIPVTQLGTSRSHQIQRTKDKRGIGIQDVINEIASAKLHLDINNGLVHVARAVGTRSIVLFHDDNQQVWGYHENQNIQYQNTINIKIPQEIFQ